MDKPTYIESYAKPKNTELKCIHNRWYLYETRSVYDPHTKKSRKVTGTYLGRVTPEGFIPKKSAPSQIATRVADVIEVGASGFCYGLTGQMRHDLMEHFPDLWERMYVLAIQRALGTTALHRQQAEYEDSILSVLYPNLPMSSGSISAVMRQLGGQRSAMHAYMKQSVDARDDYLLLDGHRILCSSRNVVEAELGYDSKHRYERQINLVYLFTRSDEVGRPTYYKSYNGSTVDVKAFEDIVKNTGVLPGNCIIVADKGFGSKDLFQELTERSLLYCVPLKRGNRYTKGRIPAENAYPVLFVYHDRPIYAVSFEHKGFTIHLYRDNDLYNAELRDVVDRTNRKNEAQQKRRSAEEKRRQNGKGRMSDATFEALIDKNPAEVAAANLNIGTVTIRTNATDLSAQQVYEIYKQRQAIEAFFKTYDVTLDFSASYMQSDRTLQAWLFLNHLSSCICIEALEAIRSCGLSGMLSWEDVRFQLSKVRAERIDDHWYLVPLKKRRAKFLEQLNIDPADFVQLISGV